MMVPRGRLLGLGVGPGDTELITLKALRLLRSERNGQAITQVNDHPATAAIITRCHGGWRSGQAGAGSCVRGCDCFLRICHESDSIPRINALIVT